MYIILSRTLELESHHSIHFSATPETPLFSSESLPYVILIQGVRKSNYCRDYDMVM